MSCTVHVCVGTYARVARAGFHSLQAAYWYLSAEAIALLENIFFSYMPSRGHQPPFRNPNNVRDTPTMVIVTRC